MPLTGPAELTGQRRTPIIATVGPASRRPEVLGAMLEAGLNCCRLNCSHSDPAGIRMDVELIRSTAMEQGRRITILLDLQGPKVRVGVVEPPLELRAGDHLELVMDPDFRGEGRKVGCTWPPLAEDLEPGDRLLFADGAMAARVTGHGSEGGVPSVVVAMEEGGLLESRKGINVPGKALSTPALTAKDLEDLEAGLEAGVDWVALSFVRTPEDVDLLREHLERLGHPELPVCAKIEKPQALDHVDAILARVDGIMVARGDLGVEISLARVPIVQKHLITAANRAGVVVITATQMLESMIHAARPTRAEVTDVANAILDGTDAVMLSGETAVGRWPVETLEVMDLIARTTESSSFMEAPPLDLLPGAGSESSTITRAACYAVREEPRPLVVFTSSGGTAVVASKSRPATPIFALTDNDWAADKLSLAWGVLPMLVPTTAGTSEMLALAERTLLERGLVMEGTEVVILAGRSHTRGSTNMMTVERLCWR